MRKIYNQEYICTQYNEGRTTVSIAKELETYNTTIRRILLSNGITPRGNATVGDSLKGNNPFASSSQQADYFLGYLAADGNLADKSWKYFKYSIRLNTCTDPEMLEVYKKWAGITTKTQHKTHSVYGTDEYCVEFCSKGCWEYLNKIGITPNKTHTLIYKRAITFDFVRGVFDGDGCITVDKTGRLDFRIATASGAFAGQLYQFLFEFGARFNLYEGIYTISVHDQIQCKRLYEKLYSNATVFFERKKRKWLLGIGNTI